MSATHKHPRPPLPNFDNRPFGRPGMSKSTAVSALLGAAAAGCGKCSRERVAEVAGDALLSAHLAACAYQVLRERAARTGVPIPPAAELAATYVSTLAAVFAAFGVDGAFGYALMFVTEAEPAKRRTQVEEASALMFEAAASGEPLT